MKYVSILALLVLVICGLNGCASTDAKTASGDPVPGENKGEESRVAPGTGSPGANASVRW